VTVVEGAGSRGEYSSEANHSFAEADGHGDHRTNPNERAPLPVHPGSVSASSQRCKKTGPGAVAGETRANVQFRPDGRSVAGAGAADHFNAVRNRGASFWIFTQANGSAIAIADSVEMVCRASAGDAPPVGAKLNIGSGFSGYCARTGFLQRCDDAETDPRVDREGCRSLGFVR